MVIRVVKASGKIEPLDLNKVREACLRAGAPLEAVEEIVERVSDFVYDGISTREIYRRIYHILEKYKYSSAVRFRLKDAIMRLGPSGFPFEVYIGEILRHYGYRTKIGVVLRGRALTMRLT
ncbi:MAG: ATP cone domain-containing protein [Candidatus Bathyarchaeia archaeon]